MFGMSNHSSKFTCSFCFNFASQWQILLVIFFLVVSSVSACFSLPCGVYSYNLWISSVCVRVCVRVFIHAGMIIGIHAGMIIGIRAGMSEGVYSDINSDVHCIQA